MTHPAVRDLFQTLTRQDEFQEVVSRLLHRDGSKLSLAGLTPTAKALYVTLLAQLTEKRLIIITDTNQNAEVLTELITTFHGLLMGQQGAGRPQLLPALDVLPGLNLSPHTEITEQRAVGLAQMGTPRAPVTIAPIASALLRTSSGESYKRMGLWLRQGEEISLETLQAHLISIGYERREPVEMTGEYSIRGGIVDIFAAEHAKPLRIEFFGDDIESIRRFDVESQRSVMKVKEAEILPLVEFSRPHDAPPGWEFLDALDHPRRHSLLDLDAEAIVISDEPEQQRAAAERLWKRLDQTADAEDINQAVFMNWDEWQAAMASRTHVAVRTLDLDAAAPHMNTRPAMSFHGSMQVAVAETKTLVEQGYRVAFFAATNGELERLADILREYSIPFTLGLAPNEAASPYLAERAYLAGPVASTYLIKGLVRRGAVFPDAHIAFIGSEDLFEASELIAKPSITPKQMSAFAADLADLKPGDYVVHTTHGVGKFLGVREIAQEDQKGDFMLLEYFNGAKLYVPLTRMDLVEKHRGAGEAAPTLDKLGGASWTQRKTKVKAKMRDMADELLKLYAQRRMADGFSFSKDSNWQREFEDAFDFTETKDQLTAVKEIKRDMESPHPMDRLLCGDVGFGKTEVCMRAAFKALGDGKQVAVLAPTTVLAYQHFETFKRRFGAFPVRIEMLSRFRAKKEIDQAVLDLAAGKVDIAIGTHRLFSKDVEFRDLGLLIIDEEQRFGVRHKERLKQLRQSVDILTMSATPIPRTLHMSMLGIRDMSVIETPPKDRLAIHTVVSHFDPTLVRTAIDQEISRGGQVYFIHNRVDSIYARAASIQELVPGCRVGVGHGQMPEDELEKVLLGFMQHEFDVFVCTTIAENGLDIPLANTIIIENADRYGLSALYQLRGRVGRSNRRAYAYLLVPQDTELSEVARKRLAALREFSDLGAGFKIAALDLELRGAGNLLGGEQHGHIASVGFDTYLRLMDETVNELRGIETPLQVQSSINLGLDIRIPPTYISEEHQRLRTYKQIAGIRNQEEADAARAELEDRYGPVPTALATLVQFALLKSAAERLGVEAIDKRGGMANVKFHPGARIQPERLMSLIGSLEGAQFTPAGVLRLPLPTVDNASILLGFLEESLRNLTTPSEATEPAYPGITPL